MQEFSVMAYTLLLTLIEYKTLVMRADFDAANEILPQIPQVHQYCTVAAFSCVSHLRGADHGSLAESDDWLETQRRTGLQA